MPDPGTGQVSTSYNRDECDADDRGGRCGSWHVEMHGADVSDLLTITSRAESFPRMRRDLAQWRSSKSANELIAISRQVLDSSTSGEIDERFTMAGALLLPPALGFEEARLLLVDGFANVDNWRVQECVAKAMDEYASLEGWDNSLIWIQECVHHPRANVRRAAVEGPRVWTARPPFTGKGGASKAFAVFEDRRNDESSYVRKSVGNAMRDIGKKYPEELLARFSGWCRAVDVHPEVVKLALRQLKEAGNSDAIEILRSLPQRRGRK